MAVEVFNALGEMVQSFNFTGSASSLDLSGKAAGIYTVRVGNEWSSSMQRIALQ
ncbi:MAG: T9SS type A sorting domain-containing protein [Flavobacteriales bacterium]|jgi:hypothetical protein|nr:T9SS type A sorting domain-containing protein [Flavobacteriales bacterium]MCB0756835.1 T9SS type A sorting domain-containing protein [Flavobacteriales bacterium]